MQRLRLAAVFPARSDEDAVNSGDRLGPYHVVEKLGEGGMGEVYRARDTRLRRDVALKVLPRSVADDPDRLARFEREAQTLAALNHPHIAAIYGVEESSGTRALVMELVDGSTLAGRIAQGPVPVDEALPIARQIAEALAAAHDAGIIHRDLKPANIKLRPDGSVKVLDFGLAKAIDSAPAGPLVDSPTFTSPALMTQAGVILGTAAYMSPEQARGRPVDRKTDIWSFGCVLYEMLCGRPAFAKPTVSDTVAAILERSADFQALPSTVPAAIRALIERCLEKDHRARRRDMADIALELEHARDVPRMDAASSKAPPLAGRRAHVRYLLAGLFGGIVLSAALGSTLWRANRAPDQVVEFAVYPPAGTTFPLESGAPWPSISPDGRQLAFVAVNEAGVSHLWLRPVRAAAAQPLAGTEGAARPFWSPDSGAIGFFADGKLKRVDLAKGTVQNLCDAPYLGGMSASWGAADTILFTHVGGFFRVPAAGGTPTLALPDRSTPRDRNQPQNPSFLPDGRRFVYITLRSKPEDGEICLGSIDTQESRCIFKAASPARYAAPGYLLFAREGVLRLQRFDADRLSLAGDAVPVSTSHVRVTPVYRPPPFSIAETALAFHPGTAEAQLVWRERNGATALAAGEAGDYPARASRDGRWLATSRVDERTGNIDIWLKDQRRGVWSRFTFHAASETGPVFSPDGSRIVFASTRDGRASLYVKPTNAAGAERPLGTFGDNEASPQDWSSDGRLILYGTYSSTTSWDIGVVQAADGATAKLLINSQNGERNGQFSPDMKWIAYDSTESGRREVWIQPFPPTGDRWQVSTTGASTPRWRGDGRELFFVAANGMLMAAAIDSGAVPVIGVATPLFQTLRSEGGAGFDVSPDGQRFLMPIPPGVADVMPITVRMNWRAAIE